MRLSVILNDNGFFDVEEKEKFGKWKTGYSYLTFDVKTQMDKWLPNDSAFCSVVNDFSNFGNYGKKLPQIYSSISNSILTFFLSLHTLLCNGNKGIMSFMNE